MIAYINDTKKPFDIRFNVDCVGEDVIVDIYTLGTYIPVHEGVEVSTVTGGLKGSDGQVNVNMAGVDPGNYSIIARTQETGHVGKDILIVMGEDGVSSGDLETPTPPPIPEGWNITTAQYVGTKNLGVTGFDVKINSDETKLFRVRPGGVYEYNIVDGDISTLEYVQYLSIGTSNAFGLDLNPEGTKLYILKQTDDLLEYDLPSGWSLTGATLNQTTDLNDSESFFYGISFKKDDGTRFYTFGINQDKISEWHMSIPWDSSTGTKVRSKSVSSIDSSLTHGVFKSDGLKLYATGYGNDKIYEIDVKTAWNISTIELLRDYSIGSPNILVSGLDINSIGTKIYTGGRGEGFSSNYYKYVFQYSMTS